MFNFSLPSPFAHASPHSLSLPLCSDVSLALTLSVCLWGVLLLCQSIPCLLLCPCWIPLRGIPWWNCNDISLPWGLPNLSFFRLLPCLHPLPLAITPFPYLTSFTSCCVIHDLLEAKKDWLPLSGSVALYRDQIKGLWQHYLCITEGHHIYSIKINELKKKRLWWMEKSMAFTLFLLWAFIALSL